MSTQPVRLPGKFLRKLTGVGVRLFWQSKRLVYRFRWPWRGKLLHLDHVTVPVTDLRVAEDFYVGLLGAQVVLRLDAVLLQRIGWSLDDIEKNAAVHLSLTLGGGPRIDLFEYPVGRPKQEAPMHPHTAFFVAPGAFLKWKHRLEKRGVIVAGPTRPGPPGQASFYFNDPFGNHLEIITVGSVNYELSVGVPDRSGLDYAWVGRSE
jgi:catechol 2,3-dioxygenase-like lactoylglutathione lyase family enzyme